MPSLRAPLFAIALAAGCIDTALPPSDMGADTGPTPSVEPTLTWPPDGTAAVGAELGAVWFVFDHPPSRPLWAWEGPTGGRVDFVAKPAECGALGVVAASCTRLVPTTRLQPGRHELGLDEGTQAWDGRLAPPVFIGIDVLAEQPPVELAPPACAIDETATDDVCVLATDTALTVRLLTNAPVRASLGVYDGAHTAPVLAARGSATLTLAHRSRTPTTCSACRSKGSTGVR